MPSKKASSFSVYRKAMERRGLTASEAKFVRKSELDAMDTIDRYQRDEDVTGEKLHDADAIWHLVRVIRKLQEHVR